MDPKNRNNPVARLQASADALSLEKLSAVSNAEVGHHLKTLGDDQAEDAQMLITVLQAAIQADGLPQGPTATEIFAAGCEALALRITGAKRKREWTETKALLDGLNARNPNPGMVLAAKRAGVELSDSAATPPKLVEG